MSWTKIERPISRVAKDAPDVLVGSGGRKCDRILISLKLSALPPEWSDDARFDAFYGEAEHLGKVRLAPSEAGLFTFARMGRKTTRGSCRLPLPVGVDPGDRKAVPVRMVKDGKGIILTLPAWAMPKPAIGAVMSDKFKPVRG
ncbi:MAG: hypothetical protein J0H82_30305 [Alphaproteobacteria bacterium]|nr:hypothetical protein [Alphaproteobacteria bacterium]